MSYDVDIAYLYGSIEILRALKDSKILKQIISWKIEIFEAMNENLVLLFYVKLWW